MSFRSFLLGAAFALTAACGVTADKVTVMLDWFINPDQAPLVIAIQKGFFQAENLNVTLIEPTDTSVAPKMAAAGKVDLAFDSQPQLYLQRQEGLPLMKVATVIDTPLNNLLLRADSGVETLDDLEGKTIGYSVPGFDSVILASMLQSAGLDLDQVKTVNVNWAITASLLAKKVDAVIGAYRVFENLELNLQGVEALAFYPEEHGIPPYDEMILVANEKLQGDPRLARFNRALEAATVWLLNHPQAAWKAFSEYKQDLDNPLNRAAWDACLPRFSAAPGALDPLRYRRFARFMLEKGLLEKAQSIPFYRARN